MIIVTTPVHKTFTCVPHIQDQDDVRDHVARLIDETIDTAVKLCRDDPTVAKRLMTCTYRQDAYLVLRKHVKRACRDNAWVFEYAREDVSRRVLFMLEPHRFGFSVDGWVH